MARLKTAAALTGLGALVEFVGSLIGAGPGAIIEWMCVE